MLHLHPEIEVTFGLHIKFTLDTGVQIELTLTLKLTPRVTSLNIHTVFLLETQSESLRTTQFFKSEYCNICSGLQRVIIKTIAMVRFEGPNFFIVGSQWVLYKNLINIYMYDWALLHWM